MSKPHILDLRGRTIALLSGLLVALGLSIDFSQLSDFALHSNLSAMENPLAYGALCVLLTMAVRGLQRDRGYRFHWGLCISGALFGFFNVCALSLHYFNSFEFFSKGIYQTMISMIAMIGYGGLYYLAGAYLFRLLDSGLLMASPVDSGRFIRGRFMPRLSTGIKAFLLILICWLPWMIAYYPGVVTWDMFCQLMQATNGAIMDDHPALSTYIMGKCMELGELFGSGNLGAFLYMLLQSIVCACTFGSSVGLMEKLGCKRGYCIGATLFFALMPVWPMYARMGHKDFLFTGVAVLLLVQAVSIFSNMQAKPSPFWYVRFGVLMLLTCTTRKNGFVFAVPLGILVAISLILQTRKKVGAIVVASAVICYAAFQAALPAFGVARGSSRDLYSLPFQQTARYFSVHGEDIDEEDDRAVNGVLDASVIARRYVPVLSDPVKATFREDATNADIIAYAKAWLCMGVQDPATYLAATLSANYGYFFFTPRLWYNDNTGPCFWYDWEIIPADWQAQFGLYLPENLIGARALFHNIAETFEGLPLLGLFYQCGLYASVTWMLFLYLIRKRDSRAWMAVIPSICVCILCCGMPVNGCLRYFLPVAACAPLTLAVAVRAAKAEEGVYGE